MNYRSFQNPTMQDKKPLEYITIVEPYVVETLMTIIGKSVIIETTRGNIQGILADVKPDHLVLKSYDNDTIFFVRIQQIVHIMPN